MDSPQPVDFGLLIARLADQLAVRGFPFMLIGGQAVLVHGEPRLTQDIDVTLGADPRRLPDALAVCAALGLQPLPADPEDFVRQTYVLPAADPRTNIEHWARQFSEVPGRERIMETLTELRPS